MRSHAHGANHGHGGDEFSIWDNDDSRTEVLLSCRFRAICGTLPTDSRKLFLMCGRLIVLVTISADWGTSGSYHGRHTWVTVTHPTRTLTLSESEYPPTPQKSLALARAGRVGSGCSRGSLPLPIVACAKPHKNPEVVRPVHQR